MADDADLLCTSSVAIASSFVFLDTYGDKLTQEDWAKVKVRLMSACREQQKILQRFTEGVDKMTRVQPDPVASYLDTSIDEAETEAHALENAA